jgi:hypothetical protein
MPKQKQKQTIKKNNNNKSKTQKGTTACQCVYEIPNFVSNVEHLQSIKSRPKKIVF